MGLGIEVGSRVDVGFAVGEGAVITGDGLLGGFSMLDGKPQEIIEIINTVIAR